MGISWIIPDSRKLNHLYALGITVGRLADPEGIRLTSVDAMAEFVALEAEQLLNSLFASPITNRLPAAQAETVGRSCSLSEHTSRVLPDLDAN